jgi:excisionase family DNA binding protein
MDSKIPSKVQNILYALETEVQKVTTVDALRNIKDALVVFGDNIEAAIKGLEAQITSKNKKPFWDVKEVAEYLSVSTVTVYSWINSKKKDKKRLEASYAGEKIRISQEALDKFLAQHEKYRPSPKRKLQKRK